MKAAPSDEFKGLACKHNILGGKDLKQRLNIRGVLGAASVIAREDLQRQEVLGPSHRAGQSRQDLRAFCMAADFGLYTGRGEQEVQEDSRLPLCGLEPDSGQPVHGILFDRCGDLVSVVYKRVGDTLGLVVAHHSDRQIQVSRESGFASNGYRPAAHDGPRRPSFVEDTRGAAKKVFDRHGRLDARVRIGPATSPGTGSSSRNSQRWNFRSITSGKRSRPSRASLCRIMARPHTCNSAAVAIREVGLLSDFMNPR